MTSLSLAIPIPNLITVRTYPLPNHLHHPLPLVSKYCSRISFSPFIFYNTTPCVVHDVFMRKDYICYFFNADLLFNSHVVTYTYKPLGLLNDKSRRSYLRDRGQ